MDELTTGAHIAQQIAGLEQTVMQLTIHRDTGFKPKPAMDEQIAEHEGRIEKLCALKPYKAYRKDQERQAKEAAEVAEQEQSEIAVLRAEVQALRDEVATLREGR